MDKKLGPYKRCKTCGKLDFQNPHICPPVWECQFDGDKADDWTMVYAMDAEGAAERFMKESDEGPYDTSFDSVALVRKYKGDFIRKFLVQAENIPQYTASEIYDKKD